jgi:hypothetical protein
MSNGSPNSSIIAKSPEDDPIPPPAEHKKKRHKVKQALQPEIANPAAISSFAASISKTMQSDPRRTSHRIHLWQAADLSVASKHGQSRRVFTTVLSEVSPDHPAPVYTPDQTCPCCGNPTDGELFSLFCPISELAYLGSSIVLYFQFVKYIISAFLLVLAVACVPCMVGNGVQDRYTEWTNQQSMNIITPSNYGNIWISGQQRLNHTDWAQDTLKIPDWQPILHVIACALLTVLYALMLTKLKALAYEWDTLITTPSDFTLMIRGLPSSFTRAELEKHICDYFQQRHLKIINTVLTYHIQEYMDYTQQIHDWEFKQNHIQHFEDKYHQRPTVKKCCKVREMETVAECEEKILELKRLRDESFTKMNTDLLGPIAFVTFRSQLTAREIENEWKRSTFQKIWGKLCFCCVSPIYRFKGNFVYAEMAPDPTDINWENLAISLWKKLFYRAITVFVVFCTLVIALAVMLGTAQWKTSVYQNKENESWIKINAATIIPPIISVIINFAIARLTRIYSASEKYSTWSSYNESVLSKLVIFMALNNIGIPIFVYSDYQDRWFNEGGLAYTVFWLEIMNAVMVPLIYLINPMRMFKLLKRFLFSRASTKGELHATQLAANNAYEGPEVDLVDRFASILKTLFLSLFFAPIVPIGPAIGLCGVVIEACIFKYMLLRVHCKPRIYQASLVIGSAEWMHWGILAYSLGILSFYWRLVHDLWPLELFFFIAICGFVLTPLNSIIFCCFKDQTLENIRNMYDGPNQDTSDNYFKTLNQFYTDYEIENPITKKTGVERKKAYLSSKSEEAYMAIGRRDTISGDMAAAVSDYFKKRVVQNNERLGRGEENYGGNEYADENRAEGNYPGTAALYPGQEGFGPGSGDYSGQNGQDLRTAPVYQADPNYGTYPRLDP